MGSQSVGHDWATERQQQSSPGASGFIVFSHSLATALNSLIWWESTDCSLIEGRGLSLTREARKVHYSFYLGWRWGMGMWPRLGQSNVSSWLFVERHKDNGIDNSSHWFNIHMGIAPSRGGKLHCLTGRWNPGCWKLSCFLSILQSWSSKFLLILSHLHALPVNYLLIQTTRVNFRFSCSRTLAHIERLKPNPNQSWYGKTCLY